MPRITEIIIHCSDSEFGNANLIRRWHLERGWTDIGYHFVILNGKISKTFGLPSLDGCIECGRYFDGDEFITGKEVGAHALGHNKKSIGICLIGTDSFTNYQRTSLTHLCTDLVEKYNLGISDVKGHYELEESFYKTCPNFDLNGFRSDLASEMHDPYD